MMSNLHICRRSLASSHGIQENLSVSLKAFQMDVVDVRVTDGDFLA